MARFENIDSDFLKLLLTIEPSIKDNFEFEKVAISFLNLFEKGSKKETPEKLRKNLEAKADEVLTSDSLDITLSETSDAVKETGDLIFTLEETIVYGKLRKFPQVAWDLQKGVLNLKKHFDKSLQRYFQEIGKADTFEHFFDTLVDLEAIGVLENPGALVWGGKTEIANIEKLENFKGKKTKRLVTTLQRECGFAELFDLSYGGINRINIMKKGENVGEIKLTPHTSLETAELKSEQLEEFLEKYEGKVITNDYPGLGRIHFQEKKRKLVRTEKDGSFNVYEFRKA